MTAAKVFHGITALVVVAALVGEFVHVARGPALTDDADAAVRILRYFSFFTVQSNILVAVTSIALARRPDRDEAWFRWMRLAALIGITITGIVYVTLLAPIHDPEGTAKLTNAGVHYFSPLASVVGWVFFGPRPRISWRTVFLVLVWPVAWLTYTLVHGKVGYNHWYPYPFVDVGVHGYGKVALNCIGVAAIALGVGALYRWLDGKLRPAP
ncbi:MAG: Pr6Pr family membrane protein [Sporichthyaceae bacterium]